MQRYSSTVEHIRHNDSGPRRYETMLYPKIAPRTTDIYFIAKKLDRCDLIASEYYDEPRLWWVIHRANKLPGGTFQIPPGFRIRVPFPLDEFEVQKLLTNNQF